MPTFPQPDPSGIANSLVMETLAGFWTAYPGTVTQGEVQSQRLSPGMVCVNTTHFGWET